MKAPPNVSRALPGSEGNVARAEYCRRGATTVFPHRCNEKFADICRQKTCQNGVATCRMHRNGNTHKTTENTGLYGVVAGKLRQWFCGLANRRFRPLSHLSSTLFNKGFIPYSCQWS